jgi:hypothetical protein
MTHRTTSHYTLDGTKTSHQKRREKSQPGISCSTYHVVIHHLYRLLLPHLFFIQARRTGFAALKRPWEILLEILYRAMLITCFCFLCLLCLAFYCGPELACSGGMGGWEICSILRGEENARIGVLSSGLDVLIFLRFILLYICSTFVLGNTRMCR